jgi:aspartyl aminopeptidase
MMFYKNKTTVNRIVFLSLKLDWRYKMKKKTAWENYDEVQLKEVFEFSEGYKDFLSDCKTERECVKRVVKEAKKAGYRDLNQVILNEGVLEAGDKVYVNNMDKAIALFLIGSEPIEKGMNILGAHIDSPRLDLKQNPLYEDTELAMLDTHYYGGIKKYQWVTVPLALHGVVVKKDGTQVDIVIGEAETDPVVGVSDLLVHLSAEQMDKKASKVVEGENLNILVGSIPLQGEEKDAVKANILKLLKDKYDIEEEDFLSAEIEAVPAGRARDYGMDRSMVMGYGHDDRVCAYPSYKALFELEESEKTSVCLFVDKEEVGSMGATGMQSKFFENTVAEIINCMGDYSEILLRRALKNSKMLSSDVSAAFDPNYPSTMEKNNSAYFGKGLVFNKYTGARGKSGSNDANAEYIAQLRNILDKNGVAFQTAELGKVDQGGGGTIAYILANYNMEVIDSGIALQNMHAPWEIASKADIYEAKKGYLAFLKEA